MRLFRLTACTLLALAYVPHAAAAIEDDLRDGDKFFEDGNWSKAATAYDRAIAKAPGEVSAEAYGKRAAVFIILKDFDQRRDPSMTSDAIANRIRARLGEVKDAQVAVFGPPPIRVEPRDADAATETNAEVIAVDGI